MRRTKIVASVGPASDSPAVLRQMVGAGMNMARVSFAHGPVESGLARITAVREAAAEAGATVGVLADLPGPKIRAAAFGEETYLAEDDRLDVVAASKGDTSDGSRLAVAHAGLVAQLEVGDRIALGDGGVTLVVESVGVERVEVRVVTGGHLAGRPGVMVPSSRLGLESPTAEDLSILDAVCAAGVDAVAVSFVRSADDIERARRAAGPDPPMVVAKIETQEAVDALEDVIAVADGVMVARGDLGIRCAMEDVPHYQKRIIQTGVSYGLPVITATQMLESMVRAPSPTRAEVSDVANAVLDGTSALMLSGETAIGHDPAAAVATMARIATRAERDFDYLAWGRERGVQQVTETRGAPASVRITAAISAAAWRAANDAGASAVIACTSTGVTAKAISRFRPIMPLLGATPSGRTARQLSVAWGVTPLLIDRQASTEDIVWVAVEAAVAAGLVATDDLVAVLVGSRVDEAAATDMLRLVRIR